MPDKDDIIRRVRALRAKTVEAGATPEEGASAYAAALRLMERHEITDDDLAEAEQDYLGSMLGGLFGKMDPKVAARIRRDSNAYIRVRKDIDSSLAVIQGQILFAVDKANTLNHRYRAEALCEFYRVLKELLGDTASWRRNNPLKPHRDEAIKAYYQSLIDERQEGEYPIDDPRWLHELARDEVARVAQLRKDTVENIVGVRERSLFEATMTCPVCGETGPARRGARPKWTKIPGPGGGYRIEIHPDCVAEQKASSNA